MFRINEALTAFDREDGVDVNLGVGVGHCPKMSLLTELGNIFCDAFYKDFAPNGAEKDEMTSRLHRCRPWEMLGMGPLQRCRWKFFGL